MVMSFAIVENGVVTNLVEAEEAFGVLMGWIPAGNAKMGDLWDGTTFTTPPPPIPTLEEYNTLLRNYMAMRANAAREALCDQILLANPSVNSVSSFLAACDAWAWE